MKLKDFPLVWITWYDATTNNEWVDVRDIQDKVGIDATTTCGFLVKEDDKAYYIASTIHECLTNAQISLPKGMVQTITYGEFRRSPTKKEKPENG